MKNLRITNVAINTSSDIDVSFSETLVSNLATSNVSIISETPNVPDSEVLFIKVIGNTINIICQPLTPMATYFLQFVSTDTRPFISLHGTAKISEDGVSNRFLILGPIPPDNVVKDYFLSYFKDSIYKISDSNTLVSKYIDALSINFARALYDIGQVKNENYLSFDIVDEQKTRGEGPFDRLNEESAYFISRVGRTVSTANVSATFSIDEFSNTPITLQKQDAVEFPTVAANNSEDNTFNINTLTFNLSNFPVTKVKSIVFTLAAVNPIFTYDIATLGYQILDSKYDEEFAFSYALLSDNQVKINDKILEDSNFNLNNILNIEIEYEYKNLGKVIKTDTVSVSTVKTSVREVLPPIINVFNLKYAPIVNSDGSVITLNGITFTDPNNPTGVHPAFVLELPFRLNGLPSAIGQYSIDYTTGTVYVYGSNLANDGTGPYPPLATYNYLFTYKLEQDYIYDPDLIDLVALPHGNLLSSQGNITFSYEEVLIPGIDYQADLHKEVLTERVNNNLIATNVIRVQNSPITNVFRIYNETSGEIYTLDRWNNDKVYFRYNNPPALEVLTGERVSFETIPNETLFVNSTTTNSSNLRIFKIYLENNSIISESEDSIGSSINTSVKFSKNDIFIYEKWFNRQFEETDNLNRLTAVGEYTIDYINGIVYCVVSNTQNFDIGTISYKKNNIIPQFPHLISVEDIYYRISLLDPKNKIFSYTSFGDGSIVPDSLDHSDELSLNNDELSIYQVSSNKVGTFVSSTFVSGVTNQVKFARSIIEYEDLLYSTNPLNFGNYSTSDGFEITIGSISNSVIDSVQFDGTNYYVAINQNIPYISNNISYSFTITRLSDSASLWNSSGTIVPGNPVILILPGINSPVEGDVVSISYSFTINDLSRVVVDYNKGELYTDYTYLADELIISYEYGDNVLDFRKNRNLPSGTAYYVTYKAGALRDALARNFGTLINIPELTNFDVDFDRERYRDALTAGLTSFIQGPTVTAIKNIGKTISHIEPEIIESIFQNWSLGNSLLTTEEISTTGSFQLLPGKFDNGVLINSSDQTITFPVSSNIRLEEGTFETWINPLWNGLDNDAVLTFTILKDGYTIDPSFIFVGAGEHHPEFSSSGSFSLSKFDIGTPNKNKDGIFIYYKNDPSDTYQRWYVEVIDGYVGVASNYRIKIDSTGMFYDVATISLPKPSNFSISTGTNVVNLNITGAGNIDNGISFVSDIEHYILDVGEEKTKNRISIYKDISGYLNFKVYDREKVVYNLSSDVSSWKSGDLHHVAASWKLNNKSNRDEMHLFVDGFEVPNIIRYGQRLQPYLHEKYRTIAIEEIVGSTTKDIISSTDLNTTSGSSIITSAINFSSYNISPGDLIFIDEEGFSSTGYTISSISGQELTLTTVMPLTLPSNGRFSVNRTEFQVDSLIDIASNIAVSTISPFVSGTITGSYGSNTIYSTVDFILNEVAVGDSIVIDDPTLELSYVILQVSTNSLVINDYLPSNINTTFRIYHPADEVEITGTRALSPSYSVEKDNNFNNLLIISNNVLAGDLILVRTLGLNHRKVKEKYYIWGDGVENILKTNLPSPISLDEVKITKVLLSGTPIGPNNSTLSGGIFTSDNLSTDQPITSVYGRTLSITLGGTNVDFSTPVQVNINGNVSETITFTDYGTIDSVNLYTSVNYINVVIKPISTIRAAGVVSVKEKYSMTHLELDGYGPIVRFSYPINYGYTLQGSGTTVTDNNNLFSGLDVGNYLYVISPSSAAGFYKIASISFDLKSLNLETSISSFSNGSYQVLNATSYRSGLQNGFFTFEKTAYPKRPYYLNKGFYEFEYFTYTRIQLDPLNEKVYLGSDFNGNKQLNGLLDQVKVYSHMLTDTRVGESIPANQRSITKDYNSLKALKKDANTTMLMDFNNFPFTNTADFYTSKTDVSKHFYSSWVVNENFGNSLVLLDDPLRISNDGILNTKKEGTIEFWINPIFDTGNDPNKRFYFDAFGAITEEVISVNNVSIKLSNPASTILSVKLKTNNKIDYFAGGKIEIDTQNAIIENTTSISNNSTKVLKSILQVISVKIVGDPTETDYFTGGAVSNSDQKTIYFGRLLPQNNLPLLVTYQTTENNNQHINTQVIRLNKKLPYQKSQVVVNYLPKGLQGDRISIFKDETGYLNFAISASGKDYIVKAPTYWDNSTWHRVKASYKINGNNNSDEMRLFIDGYQYNDVLLGSHLLFGSPIVTGLVTIGDGYSSLGNVKFKDPINELFIGSQYNKEFPVFSLIDNFRISNISRAIYAPYGEPLDVNYTSNLGMAFPVTEDLYTTYLLNSDIISEINDDLAILKNRQTGLFDFTVNIIDSLNIVSDNVKSKEALEKLIKILKPANSRAFIQYIK